MINSFKISNCEMLKFIMVTTIVGFECLCVIILIFCNIIIFSRQCANKFYSHDIEKNEKVFSVALSTDVLK
jgi:hypothetical protein